MGNKRILYLDALRVFSIFCVVVLHVCSIDWYAVGVNTSHWQALNFYDSSVRFCVPVFLMISGALFLGDKKSYTLRDLFFKKILRVATAFLFWSLVYLVFCKDVVIAGKADFVYKWLTGSRYHLWFCFTIINLYIFSPVLKEVCKSKKVCEYFLCLWFVCQCLGMTTALIPSFPQTILTLKSFLVPQAVLGYGGYYVLGHYLSEYSFSKQFRILSYIGAILGYGVTVAGTWYMSVKAGVGFGGFYDYLMPNTALVSVGLFLFFKQSITQESLTKVGRAIIFQLSKLTFGIYMIHEMFIYILTQHFGITTGVLTPALSVPLLSVVIFSLSAAAAFIISRIPILRKYII